MKTQAAVIVAVVIVTALVMASVDELYDECGSICWQGLLLALRARY